MAESFRLSVVTGEGTVFEDTVDYVNLPMGFGSVGILAKHGAMLCAVEKGVIRCRREGREFRIETSSGIANVGDNEVTVLVNSAKVPEE